MATKANGWRNLRYYLKHKLHKQLEEL